MEYFGTDLDRAGHFFWLIEDGRLKGSNRTFKSLPFNPEELNNHLPVGEVIFYQGGGFTVIGITGSCYDRRPGSKSVFWVNDIISKETMIFQIMQNKIAREIIHKMPFAVKW